MRLNLDHPHIPYFLLLTFAVLCLTVILFSSPAGATLITNLDQVPHTLLIDDYGQREHVTLPPNGHIRKMSSRLLVQVEGVRGQVDIRDNDEYVIWRGGKLSLQKIGNIRRNTR